MKMDLLPALVVLVLGLAGATGRTAADTSLSVLSFNIWGGGANQGQSVAATAAVLRAADADLVGLQEVRAEAAACTARDCPALGEPASVELARLLGYYHYQQAADNEALWANAILSRYPITGVSANDLGVKLSVAGREVVLFNIHATDFPYQPYQLLGIPYDDAPFLHTAAEAMDAARRARQPALQLLLAELDFASSAELVLLTGDFNEPSHRDWTPAAAAAGIHPLAVAWPLTLALEQQGLVDCFRRAHPDEVARPGFTWSPLVAADDPRDHADRIDYVFARAPALRVTAARIMGEAPETADRVALASVAPLAASDGGPAGAPALPVSVPPESGPSLPLVPALPAPGC